MIKKAAFPILMFFFSISAFAGDTPEAQANLLQFVGNWRLDNAVVQMGEKTMTGVYTFDCSAVCENTGILAHEKFATKESGSLVGENLLAYDPNTGLVHLYSIDNTGTTHDHYGYWIEKNHLFVQYQGIVENKMYVEQIDIKFTSPKEMKLNLTGMINGKVYAKASGTFTK
ncbi:MAG TPA: hypothetical protein VMT35_08395 [Ignavibacteriaceae bacterium]|nr:hypothetical protein [Ignavibacteriaceae bacterium]